MKKKEYEYRVDGNITYLYFTQRNGNKHVSIIDTFNLEKIIDYPYKWGVCWYRGTNDYYVRTSIYKRLENGKISSISLLLHDFLLGNKVYQHVDHINNKTLDNRMDNLRPSLQRNNLKNRKKKNSNNTSGHRNVTWINGYWRIQLQVEGKNKLFKEKFDDVDVAGEFAEKMRKKYYKEYSGKD